MRIAFSIFASGCLLDYYSTLYASRIMRVYEGNPLATWLIDHVTIFGAGIILIAFLYCIYKLSSSIVLRKGDSAGFFITIFSILSFVRWFVVVVDILGLAHINLM